MYNKLEMKLKEDGNDKVFKCVDDFLLTERGGQGM